MDGDLKMYDPIIASVDEIQTVKQTLNSLDAQIYN